MGECGIWRESVGDGERVQEMRVWENAEDGEGIRIRYAECEMDRGHTSSWSFQRLVGDRMRQPY